MTLHSECHLLRLSSQVFYAYTYGTAAWLGAQAVPLIVMPKLIIALLAPELHRTTGMGHCFCYVSRVVPVLIVRPRY